MSLKKHHHGARSLPFKRPFIAAIVVGFLHYMTLVATATMVFILIRTQELSVAWLLAYSLGAFAVTWLISYFFKRAPKCPLCKGTPLIDTRAAKHQKAVRIKPFNYATTAMVQLIFIQRFRCMYCGTLFDLLKIPSKHQPFSEE